MANGDNENGRGNTDNSSGVVGRRIKPAIAERIRNRAASSGSSGDSRGSSGDSRGSSGDSRGSVGVTTGDTGQSERGSIADPSGTHATDSGIADGLRIITGNGDRRNSKRNGDNGNRSSVSDGGNGDGRTTPELAATNDILNPEKPSLIRITDVIADEGKRKRGRPAKGDKARKNVVRINTTAVDYSDIVIPLGIALDFVFSIPVSLGWGRHWELTSEETEDLTTSIKDVLEAFPSETTTQFIRALEKYIPLLSLGIVAYGIVGKRLKETQRLLTEKKRAEVQRAKEAGTTIPNIEHRRANLG